MSIEIMACGPRSLGVRGPGRHPATDPPPPPPRRELGADERADATVAA